MSYTNNYQRGGFPPEQEDALGSVTGGTPEFIKPRFDGPVGPVLCPVCGEDMVVSGDRARCMGCHRQFRVEGSTLVEEQP